MDVLWTALRTAPWLTPARARGWARLFAGATGLAAAAMLLATHGGSRPDPWGRVLGTDFSSFWTAARLALDGHPGAAWGSAHAQAQHAAFPASAGFDGSTYAFFYPPPFLLLCLPLGLLAYGPALAAWLLATGAAQLAVLRALLPRAWPATLAMLAYPATLLNAAHGQNGALSAALLGGATLWLDRRPRCAGLCLGALCFKPQLALLVVPALLAARRWRCLLWCAAMAGLLCAAATLAFGAQAWQGFLADAPVARQAMEEGWVGFGKMASPFAAARLLGLGRPAAWLAQAGVALAVLAALCRLAARRPGAGAEGAALATAACLATPFLLDYDLLLLSVPLAWVAGRAGTRFLPWERLVLAAGFALPLVARPLALQAGLPLAPPVVAALLWVVCRRAALEAGVPAAWPWERCPDFVAVLAHDRFGVRRSSASPGKGTTPC